MITHLAKETSQQKSSGDGSWRRRGKGGCTNFEKRVGNIGGLHKIGRLGSLCQL